MIWGLFVSVSVVFDFLSGLSLGIDVGLLQVFPVDFLHDSDLFFCAKLELDLFVDEGSDKVFKDFFTGLFLNRVFMGDKEFF